MTNTEARQEIEAAKRIPAALSVRELLEAPEPEDSWAAEPLLPADGNFLLAAYPKSHKTNLVLEIMVAMSIGGRVLGRFPAPRRFKVGGILMEDSPHRVRRRLERICGGHGVHLEDLDGWLHLWFRPALQLSDPVGMDYLAGYVAEYDLDYLHIDNWSYVSTGDPNAAEVVTPQLNALRKLRDVRPQGLLVGLTQHARKTTKEVAADRLTDMIRNSSAFGAWYDVGIVLARQDETAPVTVRAELRDYPSPESFAFTVEDQHPADPAAGRSFPSGYLRLRASSQTAEQLQQSRLAERFREPVIQYIQDNPGCSKSKLEGGITGDATLIRAAFEQLCADGLARFDAPERRGMAGACNLTFRYHSEQKGAA